MSRRAPFLAVALAAVLAGVGVAIAGGDEVEPRVTTPAQSDVAPMCAAPDASTPGVVLDPALSKPAAVAVPGALSIDSGGQTPGVVAQSPDGPVWTIARDAAVVEAPVGRIARVDPDAGSFASSVNVVTGCGVNGLVAAGSSLWAATCAATGQTGTAELVELDASSGAIARRVPTPVSCITSIAVDTQVWAASPADIDTPSSVFRVDGNGNAASMVALGSGDALVGLVADGDAAWLSVRSTDGGRLVRIDPAGTQLEVAATDAPRLVGVVEGTLWTHDVAGSALVGRDAATGTVTQTVTVPGLAAAAASDTTVWYQANAPGSLTVSIGRLDDAGAPTTVTTYESRGVDRTGTPFPGTLSATRLGAWLALFDRLFLIPA